jgi:dipeptidyl aminopeptidase/acylaminoacyl peptidase
MDEAGLTTPLIPRRHLFGNPTRTGTRISPDGIRLAWLAPVDGVLNVWVAPIDNLEQARPVTNDRHRGIRIFFWTYSAHRLAFLQDQNGDENFHIHVVDTDDGTVRDLTPFEGVRATAHKGSRKRRDQILIGLNRRDPKFPDLYAVDLKSGELSLIEENRGFAYFVTDDDYVPRLAARTLPDGGLDIRKKGIAGTWEPWITFSAEDARSSGPSHLNEAGTAAFFRDSRGRNTAALTRIDLASGETTLIASHDRADIGGVLYDLDTKEPLAYGVTVERLEYFALDQRIQADLDFLASQGTGDWTLGSRSEDDRHWIVYGHSDTMPGAAYLYDREVRSLRLLHHARPELRDAPLVKQHPVTIKSQDGLDLVSYLSLPKHADPAGRGRPDTPQPTVLVVHGGPWARDAFGYHSWHQWLANRGYAVLSVNFRGSTGFGKAFINAGDHEWGRKMDDDLLDAVAWGIEEGIFDPERIAIVGGSYGGYATLASMTRNPDTYACGIDVVGPANLETLLGTIPPYWEAMRTQLYRALGDPSTEEGLRLIRERSPLYQAHRIRKPLLIAQGAHDPRVKQAESDQMVAALKENGIPVAYLLFPDEGHGLARPENSLAFHAIAEQFLAEHLDGRIEEVTAEDLEPSSLHVIEGAEQLRLLGAITEPAASS